MKQSFIQELLRRFGARSQWDETEEGISTFGFASVLTRCATDEDEPDNSGWGPSNKPD